MINACYRQLGLKKTVVFADQLMYMGFRYATMAGASIGVDDMVVPEQKAGILPEDADEFLAFCTGHNPVVQGDYQLLHGYFF